MYIFVIVWFGLKIRENLYCVYKIFIRLHLGRRCARPTFLRKIGSQLKRRRYKYNIYNLFIKMFIIYHKTNSYYSIRVNRGLGIGKSFSEALILASVNPQYDKRLFIEFPRKRQVQNILCAKTVFLFLFWHSKQYLYTTCSELVFFGEFNEQSLVILWVN